jgi:hypothetical protein
LRFFLSVVTGEVSQNPARPAAREITVRVRKNDFPAGEDIRAVVVNREGMSSDPFTVNR